MTWTEELGRLHELHQAGALTDQDFARAKDRLREERATGCADTVQREINALRRSRQGRWVAGVCGGLAQASGLEVWAWRLGFALLTMFGGAGLLAYLLMWIFIPPQ